MDWVLFALLAALSAAATAILAKIGIEGVPSNLATALRTAVVLVLAWGMVLVSGQGEALPEIGARSYLFLGLSGLATGVSWLAYFKALQMAPASRVAPLDKTSLALTILLAALVLGETITWPIGVGAGLIVSGALLTLAPSKSEATAEPGTAWWVFALIAATAAAATAILAKIGIEGVPSNLATAVRTIVVLVFAWAIVFARREHRALPSVTRRSFVFLGLSGVATGASWLAYYHALELAPASSVAPIDKVSLPFTILLAAIVLKEHISPRVAAGVVLQVGGALLTLWSP